MWVFENRVPRRLFGPKRDEVTGEWINLHIEELIDLYISLKIVRAIKSIRIRWAGPITGMGESTGIYSLFGENLKKETNWKTQA